MSKLSAQEGRALALALVALAIGCLLIPPFLSYISTNLFASIATEEGMKEQYAADAGVEYAVWKLINEREFLERVSSSVSASGTPTPVPVEDMGSVNSITPAVTVIGLDIPNPWPGRWGGQGTGAASWQGNRYLDVYFLTNEVGWIVGDTGRIMKTPDGGYAWYPQASVPGDPDLYSVSRAITETWVAGGTKGGKGIIWCANDEDETWQCVHEVSNASLRSISFVGTDNGWVVGKKSTILHYDGKNWTLQTSISDDPKRDLNSVFFADASHGWAVGAAGTVITTTNGGIDWFSQTISNKDLNDVYFVDELHGWAVGDDGTILKTWDAGSAWQEQTHIDGPANFDLQGVAFISTTITATTTITGWAVGNGGNIRRVTRTITDTNGWALPDHWQFTEECESGTTSNLFSVYFTDATHGWAVGDDWTILLYTCDESGCGWFPPNSLMCKEKDRSKCDPDKHLRSVWFADDDNGWTVGDAANIDDVSGADWIVGVTEDRASWANVELSQLPQPPTHDLFGVSFAPDMSVGWAVGANGTILKSSDGNGSWEQQTSPVLANLNAVYAISSTLAYAVGNADGSGLILKTTDGEPWSRWNAGFPDADLYDIDFIYDNGTGWTGWAVGERSGVEQAGTVIKITHAESNPSPENQTRAVKKHLYGVCALDSQTAWTVGENTTVMQTTDGGSSWSVKEILPSDVELRAVSFAKGYVGCIVGKKHSQGQTTILRTVDGGENWTLIESGAGKDLYDVFMVHECNAWAVGEEGIIVHFFCPDIGDTGGCGFFDIESGANDLSINSRVHLCLDGMHIDSWEIE